MLPEMDGFELCRTIRKESAIPIVMLTARGDVMDRVVGLELGADDYLPKPFEPRELLARLQTILRRAAPAPPRRRTRGCCASTASTIDLDRRSVQRQGDAVELTGTEFELLALLAARAAQGVQPRRHPRAAARPLGRRHPQPRGRHPGQPAAPQARAAGLHPHAAQRRLHVCRGARVTTRGAPRHAHGAGTPRASAGATRSSGGW